MNLVRKIQIVSAGLLAAATLTACDAEGIGGDFDASVEDGEVALRFGIVGGKTRNTNIVGKTQVSQVPPIGEMIDGVQLTRVHLPLLGVDLDSIWAVPEGGELFGTYDGQEYMLEYFNGAEFHVLIKNEDLGTEEAGVFVLLNHYQDAWGNVRYEFRDLTKWEGIPEDAPPTCKGDENPLTDALIVPRIRIDEEARVHETGAEGGFFIACANGAMGKVMLEELGWGYKPYDIGVDGYTTAIRSARADYCGDGHGWTLPGQEVNLDDGYGINSFFPNNIHKRVEAVWTADGASCWVPGRRRVIDAWSYEGPTPNCEIPVCPIGSKSELQGFYGSNGDMLTSK